jgi:hypothetical protein
MPAFAKTKTLWTYTNDQGVNLMFRGTTGYTSQAVVGGTAFTGLPSSTHRYGLKPRVAIVKGNLTSVKRRVVIFDPTAYDALVPMTTTIIVADASNAQETGTVQSKEGERHHGAGVLG